MRRDLLAGGGLFLSTLLVFGGVRGHPFLNCDDQVYVYKNPHVLGGLTRENAAWAFTTFHAANWHPLTWLSLQLDATLFGADRAAGFHLTNVLLHAANAVLLFLALRGMTGALWRSALAAALFGLHPLRVESVAWIAERKDVLSGLFGMLALCAYAGYARRPGPGRYALVSAALLLGLLAKPMLVTLPFVLLLLDYWPLRRTAASRPPDSPDPGTSLASVPRLVLEKAPLFLLAAASCAVTLVAQARGGAVRSLEVVPLPDRVAGALTAYVAYLGQTIWPVDLAPFYPLRRVPLLSAEALGCAALLAAVTALCLWGWRRWPYLPVGWFWYLGTLVPVVGLVQVGIQARADRYTYLPSVGLFLAGVWGAADLLGRLPAPARALRAALAAAAVLLCAAGTRAQLDYWSDNVRLWEHTLDVTGPVNAPAQCGLGDALIDAGRPADAIPHLEVSCRVMPDLARHHLLLGQALAAVGRDPEAAEELAEGLRGEPGDRPRRLLLAQALAGAGRTEDALRQFLAALSGRDAQRLAQNEGLAYSRFGKTLFHQGKYRAARDCFERAVAREPGSPWHHGNLALALAELHDGPAARSHFDEARRLDPEWPRAAAASAWSALTQPGTPPERVADALLLARQSCEATGNTQPEFLRVLAEAYAAAGRFPEAERVAVRAVEEAGRSGMGRLVGPLREQLRLYQAGKSLREAAPPAGRPG
jgi:tetratricopeptide (TPR) repeat protein